MNMYHSCFKVPGVCSVFLLITCAHFFIPHQAAALEIVAQTGQTIAYEAGDDGSLEKGVAWPSPRFMVNGDGTVTDYLTNLVWTRDASCATSAITWAVALDNAKALKDGICSLTDGSVAGDWRLPNVRELESLIHAGVSQPAVPNSAGTGKATVGNPFTELHFSDYWTSTTNVSTKNQAFTINMEYGFLQSQTKATSRYAMFVRDNHDGSPLTPLPQTGQTSCYDSAGTVISCSNTGQDGELQKGTVWPSPRFKVNNDGTVMDNLTGIVWLQQANCTGAIGWRSAVSWAYSLSSGSCGLSDETVQHDWRLPNYRELLSLIDYGRGFLAIPGNAGDFSQFQSGYYWSSTTYAYLTGYARFVDVRTGSFANQQKTGALGYALAVRDEVISRKLTVNLQGLGSGTVKSTPAGINCPGTCQSSFERNTKVTLEASPNSVSSLSGWSISGCGLSSTCSFDMGNEAQTVTVTFDLKPDGSSVPAWLILLFGD